MSKNCVQCVKEERTRPDLLCDTCGRDVDIEKLDKSRKAIKHVLERIRDDSAIGWYMGHGTQTFEFLTKAAAALWNEPLDKVEELFSPLNPKDPRDKS